MKSCPLLLFAVLVLIVPVAAVISVNVNDLFGEQRDTKNCHGCHRFDGIGAVSGGGATSRMLRDYPESTCDKVRWLERSYWE